MHIYKVWDETDNKEDKVHTLEKHEIGSSQGVSIRKGKVLEPHVYRYLEEVKE